MYTIITIITPFSFLLDTLGFLHHLHYQANVFYSILHHINSPHETQQTWQQQQQGLFSQPYQKAQIADWVATRIHLA